MSLKHFINLMLGAVAIALMVLVPKALLAGMPYDGVMSRDECTVKSPLWQFTTRGESNLTLMRAIYHANLGGGQHEGACLKTIRLQPAGDTIAIRQPMVIDWGGGMSQIFTIVGEGSGSQDASGKNNGIVRIDAYNFESGDEPCLITINAPYVRFENIEFTNVPTDKAAVCMNGASIEMRNVHITSGGTDGFVFGPESTNSKILADSEVKNIPGYGVVFNGVENSLSNSIIEVVGDLVGDELARWTPAASDTDAHGLALPPSGAADPDNSIRKFTISLPSVDKYFKNESSTVTVVIGSITETDDPSGATADTYLWMQGKVVEGDSTGAGGLCSLPATNKAARIQIYNGQGFYGYVGPWSDVYDNAGLGTRVTLAGYFSIYLKKGDPNTEYIMLVPEADSGQMGKPSRAIHVVETNPESVPVPPEGFCYNAVLGNEGCDTNGDGVCNELDIGGDDGDDVDTSDWKGFTSEPECVSRMSLTTEGMRRPTMPGYDSDGDGLLDDTEDQNRNCACDPGETCWHDPDSDHDGVPDGMGREIVCKFKDPITGKLKTSTVCVKEDGTKADNYAMADFDKDGKPNALDDDSDNDALIDGVEDRNLYYEKLLETLPQTGVLYKFKGLFEGHVLKFNGASIPCELDNRRDLGIRYDWYITTYQSREKFAPMIAAPQLLVDGFPTSDVGAVGDDSATVCGADGCKRLEILQCRHQALSAPENFNGQYNPRNLETDMLSVDTDGDEYCDGPGAINAVDGANGCGVKTHDPEFDHCPATKDTTNACDLLPCSTEVLLYGVQQDYVEWDGNVPKRLKRNADGKIMAFFNDDGSHRSCEEIDQICFGDIDLDGIPNCVESPQSICTKDTDTGLNANMADSDNDDFMDGWRGGDKADVCPAGDSSGTGSPNDKFEEGRMTGYSCDPTKVYTANEQTQILSCFLDRDSDTYRDAAEDKNMDGKLTIIEGLAGLDLTKTPVVVLTESNPLAKFTDEDAISDDLEISGSWRRVTNPADPDTDHDGLWDSYDGLEHPSEDRNHDHLIDFSIRQGEDGCKDAMTYDTDPIAIDSDGDGLEDNTEITGSLIIGQDFVNLIAQIPFPGEVYMVSDPTSPDSDNDGVLDGDEYSGGALTYEDSNPCMSDSDSDSVPDKTDLCPLNPNGADEATCGTGSTAGADWDGDGVADRQELTLGTDPRNNDSDNDDLLDGEEDIDHDGIYKPSEGESNPMKADTDEDGLTDGYEVRYGTDPTNEDSDGDCINDGIEDANQNGVYNAGAETSATTTDTDGDGLADGNIGGVGEDLNCNGTRDSDEEGRWLETDPRLPDSDYDGIPDYEEMTSGGYFNLSNVENASTGREGCMTVAGTNAAPTSMIYLFGLLLIVNRAVSRCLRKR